MKVYFFRVFILEENKNVNNLLQHSHHLDPFIYDPLWLAPLV